MLDRSNGEGDVAGINEAGEAETSLGERVQVSTGL
jgi:hypothetical protein